MRKTIGSVGAWSIADAQKEARRLQTLIDQGHDPRQVIADAIAAKETQAAALVVQQARETVTVGMAWAEYIAARKPFWGGATTLTMRMLCNPAGSNVREATS